MASPLGEGAHDRAPHPSKSEDLDFCKYFICRQCAQVGELPSGGPAEESHSPLAPSAWIQSPNPFAVVD